MIANKFLLNARTDDSEVVELLNALLQQPLRGNRTDTMTRSLFNVSLQFDVREHIPLCMLRKQYIKGIFYELKWFLQGRTDLEYLHDHNVHIWDANAQTHDGKVGPIYGHQWRHFGQCDCYKGFDQIKYVINELKKNPASRRIMLSGWCPPTIFNACLPPCHVSYNFNVCDGYLYTLVLQRSSDVALALSWNVCSATILTHMLANICGLKAHTITFSIANAHIYEIHEPVVREMIRTPIKEYPSFAIKQIDTPREINDFEFNDLIIGPYNAPVLKLDMVV